MRLILRCGILLASLEFGVPAATAQTEPFFATGVDSSGWARAQSNATGQVLIESPEYPRGLWLHLVDEAGAQLAGLEVEYQGRPDSLVAIRCLDPTGSILEMVTWSRPDGAVVRLTLTPGESTDLPAGVALIDWQIDPDVLKPMEEMQLTGWGEVSALLRKRWQDQTGRIVIQLDFNPSFAVELHRPEIIQTLFDRLRQVYQSEGVSLGESTALDVQVFGGGLALHELVVIHTPPLFPDPNLERLVRATLDQPQGPLTPKKVSSLWHLIASNWGIHDLRGLEHLTSLWQLYLGDEHIEDLTPLAGLTNLQRLGLPGNQISDLTPLAGLTNLDRLHLDNNRIVDLTPLAGLTLLEFLNLERNRIKDLAPLVANPGWVEGDVVKLGNNPLSAQARNEQIPALRARGVTVYD